MMDSVRVELHCHSIYSDGAITPEQAAARLAAEKVEYAALTDHDSIEGLHAFNQAAARLGIGCISGIELTTFINQHEIHLLGYGFVPDHEELRAVLAAMRPAHNTVGPNYVAQARISPAEGIALLHKAGGLVFLAHPGITEPDPTQLAILVKHLRADGLDGVEVFRPELNDSYLGSILSLANRHELLTSAGTDFHFLKNNDLSPGIEMPMSAWKAFRDAILAASARQRMLMPQKNGEGASVWGVKRIRWQYFAVHIAMPAFLALLFFAGVLLFAVLPTFEQALLDRKREMIRELTNTAWSVLAEAALDEVRGTVSGANARLQAIRRIEAMRYGREGKDYFWIQDTTPRMVMHPYRTDLNGTDLTGFTDPSGAPIFVKFALLAKEKNEGYVKYVWQWKDDPSRLEPKESYIRLFAPWGWIIGTGIYVHDVKDELRRMEQRLALFSGAIFALITLLLMYVMRSSLLLERKRTIAEELLRETTDRYKTLVDAATEGMLFIIETRCRYGNPMVLELLGYAPTELELLDITDIIPPVSGNERISAAIGNIQQGSADPIRGVARQRDGTLLECTFTVQPTGTTPSPGILVLLRRADSGLPARSYGVLGKLLKLPASIAQDIREEILHVDTTTEITALCLKAPRLVQSLLDNGAVAPEIARMLSSITDAATCRLIAMAIKKFGEPPCAFAFVALGSQGRMEQTLFTDQDNAIIHAAVPEAELAAVSAYFGQLADFVCAELVCSGYRNCKGKVMANNPRWCQPVAVWKEYFNEWIGRADLHELMEFSIFFDLRVVYGDDSLGRELREHVLYRAGHSARFFPQVAVNALQFKSPLRLFGIVMGTPGKKDGANHIDLKSATMPLVSFARLYALQQGVAETNTKARIEELVRKGVLLPSAQEEIITAYTLLLRLRLRHQSATMQSGGLGDNLVDASALGHIEEAILRECFNEIDLLQARIRRDFLGEGLH